MYLCLPLDLISISVSLLSSVTSLLHSSLLLLFHPLSPCHSLHFAYWKPAAMHLLHKCLLISNEKKSPKMEKSVEKKTHSYRFTAIMHFNASTTVLNKRTSIFDQILKRHKHIYEPWGLLVGLKKDLTPLLYCC